MAGRGSGMSRLTLPKFSIGVGDRFARQARAQLTACVLAAEAGVEVVPVWNKSNREHLIIGSEPAQTRAAADAAVKGMGWAKPYFVDADHITLKTVERFLAPCDFFTIDVAEEIGKAARGEDVEAFVRRHPELMGEVLIPGIDAALRADVEGVARKFLGAVQEAGRIYRRVVEAKGAGSFVAEVSIDETDVPQTPVELLIILAALADEGVAVQTIAPKFTGRFNKGVDYVGDVRAFAKEFEEDIAAIGFAVKTYGLPDDLKLSVHSGSDKFSIYGAIHAGMKKFDAGVHLKTAGTTWLEELAGLAEAGGEGLDMAKDIYREAFAHSDELRAPYATVIAIDDAMLPKPEVVDEWTAAEFVAALRHDSLNPAYNASLRQLLHVGFKVAAKLGERYLAVLEEHEAGVARHVTGNLFERHIRPLFIG